MTDRFEEIVSTQKIIDTKTEKEYNGVIDEELLEVINDIAYKSEENDFNSMVYDLGVLLMDPLGGIVVSTLKENFYEKFKDFDTATAWMCLVDEINRINSVLELHDALVDMDEECIKKINQIIKDNKE